MSHNKLQTYRRKRNTAISGEPAGGGGTKRSERPVFVIQKHDASSLHYDFRLEIDGVLKSWAVPKGPSTDPREKRLAVATEDHPLEYAGFEGVIPQHEYGGGTVLIWDRGSYENLDDDQAMQSAYDNGHLSVRLHGDKLSGGYALTRFRKRSEQDQWLLVKMDDEQADARRNPVATQPESVTSGRGLSEVAEQARDYE